ncbi:MAG: hypothetical protein ABH856_00795 [Patescibacteria group bacterium]|nr:hypothetical protein [Patescibacteria group bacterium]
MAIQISCSNQYKKYNWDMKFIFTRKKFPKAPGGDRYEWKAAETEFAVPTTGRYIIEITASAENEKRNGDTDDDDLRVALDGFEFGKYEVHDEKISWKGFGTASSWDGASLKGGTKIIHFFVELNKGKHKLQFYADGIPALKEIKVVQFQKGKTFNLNEVKPKENIDTDKKGIPWFSFVFLGVKPKDFEISTVCESATKEKPDGDNVKVVVNGKILQNKKATTSRKYKNFYFSGDLNKGKKNLKLAIENFVFFEDSVELWYDQKPILKRVEIKLHKNLDGYLDDLGDKRKFYKNTLAVVASLAKRVHMKYTSMFLVHALKDTSKDLLFKKNDPLIQKIKKDKTAYSRILEIIKKELKSGNLKSKIILDSSPAKGDEVIFSDRDLSKSLHGIKNIEYEATKKQEGVFRVKFILHDVYDFDYKSYSDIDFGYGYLTTFLNNLADRGENLGVVNNFNIRIKMETTINLNE